VLKIITVLGARPQFIKTCILSQLLRFKHNEIMIHTGQHYDYNMSNIFFNELQIPKPDYNLCIGSGNHGFQTGNMLIKLEDIYLKEKPDLIIVYGDTNSTLSGALCASKLLIPVAHIEAGLRSFNINMPEEQNRLLTDHISTLLFVPTNTAKSNLRSEGIVDHVYNVGDIMFDTLIKFKYIAEKKSQIIEKLNCSINNYIVATIHRAENTNDVNRLKGIIEALNECNENIVLPLHPRTKKCIKDNGILVSGKIKVIEPIGYLDMLQLETHCKKIVTDSGGIQKEAYLMKKPCVTLRDETEWIETIECGWNELVGTDKYKIIEAIVNIPFEKAHPALFGDGNTSEKIVEIINKEERFLLRPSF